MKEKGVIDRIEGSKAVLLIGESQDKYDVEKTKLPDGAKAGDWLKVEIRDDHIFSIELDRAGTSTAANRIANKLDQLKKKSR